MLVLTHIIPKHCAIKLSCSVGYIYSSYMNFRVELIIASTDHEHTV